MPSQQLNDVIGALGGAVLAGCLVPQLWKLYWTRSAQDLSYLFLFLYNLGLLLSFIYLFHEGATVGWICMLVELGFASTMVLAKGYLDCLGPRGALRKARAGEGSTNGGLKGFDLDVAAPMPQLCPAPGHAAQHLLLDARLALPGGDVECVVREGSVRSGGGSVRGGTHFLGMQEGSVRGRGAAAAVQRGPAAAAVLAAVAAMLEEALKRGGAAVRLQHLQSLPALRCGAAAEQDAGVDAEAATPDMVFCACSDGYATAVLHPAATSLSVDFLAASNAAVPRMGAAAAAFCQRLRAEYPGTSVSASTLARLPMQ